METHTSDFEDASTPRVQERIAQASKEQEQQLDALHTGVRRLKNQAVAVNDEVVQQNELIDHIAVSITDADAAVEQQTQAAKKVVKHHQHVRFVVSSNWQQSELLTCRTLLLCSSLTCSPSCAYTTWSSRCWRRRSSWFSSSSGAQETAATA